MDYEIDDEWLDWDSCPADPDMTPLDQLKLVQHVNRHIMPLLDAYQVVVLNQIVDRTIGWKKRRAIFSAEKLYGGDTVYGGLSRNMHRSKMMAALKGLEERGVILRQSTSDGLSAKIYSVNFDISIEELEKTAPPRRRPYRRSRTSNVENEDRTVDGLDDFCVSNRDQPVSNTDYVVSNKDQSVSSGDPREGYQDKRILRKKNERIVRAAPADPLAQATEISKSDGRDNSGDVSAVNPPPRTRRRV